MASKRIHTLNLCAAIFVTMNAIYHVWCMVVNGARPVDWISLTVEILVLAAILWFELPEWRHKRRAEKQAQLLVPFLETGEALRSTAHYSSTHDFMKWMDDARKWGVKTQDFLAKQSPRAASAFRHTAHLRETDRAVITEFGDMQPVTGLFGDAYQLLQARLDNLQRVMENPEAYF